MSDAEATIRHTILDGYSSSIGIADTAEKRIEAIFQSLFKQQTKWAIEEYLKEIEK